MKRILGGFIIVAAALAVACGGDDNDESTTADSAESPHDLTVAQSASSIGTGGITGVNTALQSNSSGVTVVGSGEVEVKPDIAIITLAVGSGDNIISSSGLPSVQLIDDQELQAVVDLLRDNGVAEDDIYVSTSSGGIISAFGEGGAQITFQWNKPEEVNRIVEDARGALREKTDYSLQSVSVVFSLKDCTETGRKAQELALEDARNRAEALAEMADLNLGGIVAVSELPGLSLAGIGLTGQDGCADISGLSFVESYYPPPGINTAKEITVSAKLGVTFAAE